ncbi:hypothetical protein [Mesorhizobium marinum]|uniref:hypothetical protein n=1 Tax=Mesorhizobium marinum TaxID=3228790 RepID=UPI003467BAC8
MDLATVIERHRAALQGIVAALVAMVAFGAGRSMPGGDGPARLPRHLHRAVLRLLRPAESAARRLAVALACRLAWPPPVPHALSSRPAPARVASGVLAFPLLDPLARWRRRRRPAAVAPPRISVPGVGPRPVVPAWRPPLPDDPLDARRLGRRFAALAGVLDDLPGLARRFQRWQARRDRALAAGRSHRVGPLRGGRPPGGRLARHDPDAHRGRSVRDVDVILAHAHALAHHALTLRARGSDTS